MNRQIKFRIPNIDIPTEKFSHFDYWGAIDVNNNHVDNGSIFKSPGHSSHCRKEWHQQFTGLLDKNRKEIYEGDIVKWDDGSNGKYWRVAVVYWDEDECLFCFRCVRNSLHPLSTDEGEVFGSNFALRDKASAARELIKVGNIYEHPEILKPSKLTTYP